MTIHLIYSVGRPMARGGRGRRWSFRCHQMPSTSKSIWEIIGEYLGKYLGNYLGKHQMPSTSQSVWENIKCHQLPNLFGKILGNIWENIWENIKCHQLTNLTGKLLGNIWENIKLHQLSNLFSQFNIGECLRTYLGIGEYLGKYHQLPIFGNIVNLG